MSSCNIYTKRRQCVYQMISKIYMLLCMKPCELAFPLRMMISEAVKTFASIRVRVQIIIISQCIKFSFYISWRCSNMHQLVYMMSVAAWFEFHADM